MMKGKVVANGEVHGMMEIVAEEQMKIMITIIEEIEM